ncbi:MAG: CpsD/CapB family tyrosine-protein kinase [Clostridia bacterium]|nr:CpsD/CapB family tyrosine-protein kinase [Clostridia bacterium]
MPNNEIISFAKPKSIASEAYRTLRTNLEFSLANGDLKTILVTSSHVSEGKSSTAANLATVFAMQDKKVVLIDADMRRGIQHKKFDISNQNGLSNYLANMSFNEKNFIKNTDIPNLSVITCGHVPPNPAELVSSPRMKELLDGLKEDFDIIIIDGVPVLPVTDSVILSSIVDKVVIVACYGETHKDELKSVKTALDNAGANIAGVILNKVEMENKCYGKYSKYSKYGNSYYGGYYSSDDDDEGSKKVKKSKKITK